MRRLKLIVVLAVASIGLAVPTLADAQPSALKLKQGEAGCTSEYGDRGCADGVALHGAGSIVISPDGEHAYVATQDSDALVVMNRNPETGRLTQKSNGTAGCVSESGTRGRCANGKALDAAETVAISPDGANVYVGSRLSDAVAVFDRDPDTGRVSQKPGRAGCISETGTGGQCVNGTALDAASTVTVSPDGANVYVVSRYSDAVVIFDRHPLTGALTQKAGTAGCISEDGTGGACADGRGLLGAGSVAVSPNGANAYAASQDDSTITIFNRGPATGALIEKPGAAGCIAQEGAAVGCAKGTDLFGTRDIVVAPDGLSAYATSIDGDAMTIFDRDPVSGTLAQLKAPDGCFNEDGVGQCKLGRALDGAEAAIVSPDGNDVYAVAALADSVVAFDRGRAPNTKITKAPKAKVRTPKKAARVSVSFKSELGTTFRCRLDDSKFEACESPWRTKAAAKRGKGRRHQIRIKATDAGANVESKPARARFRVIRR